MESVVYKILGQVAEYYEVSMEDLLEQSRKAKLVRPRQVAMYLLKEHYRLSLPAIAEKMRRDHTTVLHGVRQIRAAAEGVDLKRQLRELKARLDHKGLLHIRI